MKMPEGGAVNPDHTVEESYNSKASKPMFSAHHQVHTFSSISVLFRFGKPVQAVSAAVLTEDRHDFLVMLLPRPIALEFEQHLQRSHGNSSRLLHAANRSVVCDAAGASRGIYYRIDRHISLHRAAMMRFFRPAFLTAAMNSSLSQAFMLDRSMVFWSGNKSSSCGVMVPQNPLDSTAVRITGTPKIFAAFASTRTLFSKSCRSMLPTPENICG